MKKYVEKRPWGGFEQYTHNEVSTVKILIVNPGQVLSYQRHKHREEFWKVIEGSGYAVHNDKRVQLGLSDELFIKQGDKHRLGSDVGMKVLEISFGDFDENDNERLEDNYGRGSPK